MIIEPIEVRRLPDRRVRANSLPRRWPSRARAPQRRRIEAAEIRAGDAPFDVRRRRPAAQAARAPRALSSQGAARQSRREQAPCGPLRPGCELRLLPGRVPSSKISAWQRPRQRWSAPSTGRRGTAHTLATKRLRSRQSNGDQGGKDRALNLLYTMLVSPASHEKAPISLATPTPSGYFGMICLSLPENKSRGAAT